MFERERNTKKSAFPIEEQGHSPFHLPSSHEIHLVLLLKYNLIYYIMPADTTYLSGLPEILRKQR